MIIKFTHFDHTLFVAFGHPWFVTCAFYDNLWTSHVQDSAESQRQYLFANVRNKQTAPSSSAPSCSPQEVVHGAHALPSLLFVNCTHEQLNWALGPVGDTSRPKRINGFLPLWTASCRDVVIHAIIAVSVVSFRFVSFHPVLFCFVPRTALSARIAPGAVQVIVSPNERTRKSRVIYGNRDFNLCWFAR